MQNSSSTSRRLAPALRRTIYGGILLKEEERAERGLSFVIAQAETELGADEQFFHQHPDRRHRIRPAFANEFLVHQCAVGHALWRPGYVPYVVVRVTWDEEYGWLLVRAFVWVAEPGLEAAP